MDFQNFDEIIKSFKEPYKLNKYQKKNNIILDKIINNLQKNKAYIKEILEDENSNWDQNYNIDTFYSILNKYKEREETKNHKFGLGNIVAIESGTPYLHLELIMNAIIANCRIMFVLNANMSGFNLYITSVVRDILEEEKIDPNMVSCVNLIDYKSKMVDNQDAIDCILVNKEYEEYNFFVNKVTSKLIYLDYGNINIYYDSDEYDEQIDEIASEFYKYDINIYKLRIDDIEELFVGADNNFIYNASVIFSKDLKKCMRFYEAMKAQNIFINKLDINEIDIGLDIKEIQFSKKLIIDKE